MSLVVLVPVLRRPHRVQPFLSSLHANTPDPVRALFICDPDDRQEHAAVSRCGAEMLVCDGNYARKIAAGVEATVEPLIFTAADDLHFHPHWFEHARRRIKGAVRAVGVNDLCTRRVIAGRHATHFLITRDYALQPTLDGLPGPFCQLYDHSFCDDEFVATARHRDAIAFARDSIVEHHHWLNGKTADDEVYRKGRAKFRQDRALFRERQALWA